MTNGLSLFGAAMALTLTSVAVGAEKAPLLITLTFDDGVKCHIQYAAPMIEKHGWRGTFNIESGAIGKDKYMTWDDVRELKRRGHEIASHTIDHPDLVKLLAQGKTNEVIRQYRESRETIRREIGTAPRFMCHPYCDRNPETDRLCWQEGMVPMSTNRRNFGHGVKAGTPTGIGAAIEKWIAEGKVAQDVLMHGVCPDNGWYPFDSVADFGAFLDELASYERRGIVKVVSYGEFLAADGAELRSTTYEKRWQNLSRAVAVGKSAGRTIAVDTSKTDQQLIGFGSCISELSHDALWLLPEDVRKQVLDELFKPGGLNLAVMRLPIGANDFATNFYTYAETPNDFNMDHFTIARDHRALLPLANEAKKRVPAENFRLWGSPWCPPLWMKRTGCYACHPAEVNNCTEATQLKEGEDGFICEDRYFAAYAKYFCKYIDAYREAGFPIWMVMPQNEFNSAQVFPSCVWKAPTLAKFIGEYLGPAMEKKGVEVYFGTMERPNIGLLEPTMNNPKYAKYIKGAAFQWDGRSVLPKMRAKRPDLVYVMSEQECGEGKNDWTHALHCWDLMKAYFDGGVAIYDYWNIALKKGETNAWKWPQNALILVDAKSRTFEYMPEFYVFKQLSHYVLPGAKRVKLAATAGDALAFVNGDGSVVVATANQKPTVETIAVEIGAFRRTLTLPPSSVNTFFLTKYALETAAAK